MFRIDFSNLKFNLYASVRVMNLRTNYNNVCRSDDYVNICLETNITKMIFFIDSLGGFSTNFVSNHCSIV